jgi:hypothetical protein
MFEFAPFICVLTLFIINDNSQQGAPLIVTHTIEFYDIVTKPVIDNEYVQILFNFRLRSNTLCNTSGIRCDTFVECNAKEASSKKRLTAK